MTSQDYMMRSHCDYLGMFLDTVSERMTLPNDIRTDIRALSLKLNNIVGNGYSVHYGTEPNGDLYISFKEPTP